MPKFDPYTEVVDGTVIGPITWGARIMYEGKELHRFWFESNENPEEMAREYLLKRKAELGDEFKRLWPGDFELRIYDQ